MITRAWITFGVVWGGLLLDGGLAQAQQPSPQPGDFGDFGSGDFVKEADPVQKFQNLIDNFKKQLEVWRNRVTASIKGVFFLLASISLSWSALMLALRGSALPEITLEVTRFLLTLALTYWCLEAGPDIAKLMLKSFIYMGSWSGPSFSFAPEGGIRITMGIEMAWKILRDIGQSLSAWNIVSGGGYIFFISGINLISTTLLFMISFNVIIVYLQGWLTAYAGVIVLGFSGNRWGSEIPMQYFRAVGGIGLQLMTMLFIQGLGYSAIDSAWSARDNALSIVDSGMACGLCLLVLMLCQSVPTMVSGLISGTRGETSLMPAYNSNERMVLGGVAQQLFGQSPFGERSAQAMSALTEATKVQESRTQREAYQPARPGEKA